MAMDVRAPDDDEGEIMCEMNTTPLIDVMLVLLIMLIITIPIQTHAVKLNMPSSNTASAPSEPPKVVQIAIGADGSIKWDGESVQGREALEARITEAARLSPQPEVHLRPDGGTLYDVVAMVMASAQRLGLTKIGVTGSEAFR
ncbi:MAG: biopolymer transporter ExbD [Myxococcales bacterium]|nr:MAG: biopolymer transporter ExbD [Myxococcales bacterium]